MICEMPTCMGHLVFLQVLVPGQHDPELLFLVVCLGGCFDDAIADGRENLFKVDEDIAGDGKAFESRHQNSGMELGLLHADMLAYSLIECFREPVRVSTSRCSLA